MRSQRAWGTGLCAALLLLPLTGCGALGGARVRGSGVLKSEQREVADFSSIALTGTGHVIVKQTGRESLSVRAEDNLLRLLETKVAGGTLSLGTAPGANLQPTKPIEYVIEVKSLAGLSLAGAGDLEASGVDGDRLTVSISGAGNVTVSGKARALELSIAGAGKYQGEQFQTQKATVRSGGAGSAVVNASEELDVTVSGVGSVEYLGSPKVRQTITGVGSVKKR
jgi:hypothetical protein